MDVAFREAEARGDGGTRGAPRTAAPATATARPSASSPSSRPSTAPPPPRAPRRRCPSRRRLWPWRPLATPAGLSALRIRHSASPSPVAPLRPSPPRSIPPAS
uniref:Uncharacterized protein n=1 Tax=Oryza rufipogon TaxID=4529 RepID=A0A0E0MZX7_ORYRU